MEEEKNRWARFHQEKPKRRWGVILGVILGILLMAAILFCGTVWVIANYFSTASAPADQAVQDPLATDARINENINVLLLGIDDGDSEAAATEPKRTDAMMLVSINPETNRISVVSIPRDTKVLLPGHSTPEKINAAYSYGGTLTAKQTVSQLLQVPIHYYALANWQGFIDVIDLLGGVDIYVEKDMYYTDPYADLVIDIKKGYQHFDGETAGKYVRFRSDELGDIGRVQRQQHFMKALAGELLSFNNLGKMGSLLATVDEHLDTDLDTMTLLKIVNSVKFFGEEPVKSCVLYGEFDDSTGISYWATNERYVRKTLDELGIPYHKEEEEEAGSASE